MFPRDGITKTTFLNHDKNVCNAWESKAKTIAFYTSLVHRLFFAFYILNYYITIVGFLCIFDESTNDPFLCIWGGASNRKSKNPIMIWRFEADSNQCHYQGPAYNLVWFEMTPRSDYLAFFFFPLFCRGVYVFWFLILS